MSRSPLAYPLTRAADSDVGGAADVDLDRRRRVAHRPRHRSVAPQIPGAAGRSEIFGARALRGDKVDGGAGRVEQPKPGEGRVARAWRVRSSRSSSPVSGSMRRILIPLQKLPQLSQASSSSSRMRLPSMAFQSVLPSVERSTIP